MRNGILSDAIAQQLLHTAPVLANDQHGTQWVGKGSPGLREQNGQPAGKVPSHGRVVNHNESGQSGQSQWEQRLDEQNNANLVAGFAPTIRHLLVGTSALLPNHQIRADNDGESGQIGCRPNEVNPEGIVGAMKVENCED